MNGAEGLVILPLKLQSNSILEVHIITLVKEYKSTLIVCNCNQEHKLCTFKCLREQPGM